VELVIVWWLVVYTCNGRHRSTDS